MSEPISQAEIEKQITRLSALCEKATQENAKRGRAEAEAKVAYDRKYWPIFMATEGSIGHREGTAKEACLDEYAVWQIAIASHDAAKEAGRNYRSQLEGYRSLNANLRPLVTG